MVLVNGNRKLNADKHTHLEWFSPSETVMRQIPWQVSMSPFWTASLSWSWRASTWGTSFSRVFTYLQHREMQKRTVKHLIVKPSGSKATHYSTCKGLHVQSGSLYDEHETDSLLTAKADVCIAPSRDKHLFQIKYLFKSVQPLILHTHPKKPTHLPENQKIYSKPLLLSVIILSSSCCLSSQYLPSL